jgi:predicted permease
MVAILSRYIGRLSVRALDLTLDWSILWVGAGLAIVAAALLAFVPRLPSTASPGGLGLATGSARVTMAANRKLRVFAVVQIAASFVLVVAAAATVKTLLSLESVRTGFETRNVLSVEVPIMRDGRTPVQISEYYRSATEQIRGLPGVQNVAIGSGIPWRDGNTSYPLQFGMDGHPPAAGEAPPRAGDRVISPAFFATLGLAMIEGRDFTDADRRDSEPVAIISLSVAQRMFPNSSALNHHVLWTDPLLQFAPPGFHLSSRRIVGVVPDMDDVNLVPKPAMTIYEPFAQESFFAGGNLFVHARSNPYALVPSITRIFHQLLAEQPVERAQTLDDVRADVLSPERLNAAVSAIFAGVALLIAVVGIAGVLAFSVSGRTREFGIRLAVGSQPRNLLLRVIAEGAAMAAAGLALGFGCGYWLAQLAGSLIGGLQMPGVLPVAGAALVLLLAAVTAAAIPAARAARIDVIQALRTE